MFYIHIFEFHVKEYITPSPPRHLSRNSIPHPTTLSKLVLSSQPCCQQDCSFRYIRVCIYSCVYVDREDEDEGVTAFPIVRESASKLLETGLNTLQKTLLLKQEVRSVLMKSVVTLQ